MYGYGPGVAHDLIRHERADAAKARQIEARRLVERPVGHAVREPAAGVAPGRVTLDLVVPEHDVEPFALRVLPQPHRLTRRILPIVIEVDDVGAARVAPAAQDGVVLAEVPRVLDEGDGDARRADEVPAHVRGGVGTSVVDQDDLVPALDRQRLDVVHERRDGGGAVVQRDHEAEGQGHARVSVRSLPGNYQRNSGRPCGRLGHGIEARIASMASVKKIAASR